MPCRTNHFHATFTTVRHILASIAIAVVSTAAPQIHAQTPSMGFTQLPQPDGGKVTVFYPSTGVETEVKQGPFSLSWASNGPPVKGNSHLIVISHGSGGSPWVHTDLARTLVQRGFTVALPQHHGDNYQDPAEPGPPSWRKRPQEVSKAIDIVAGYAPLAVHLSFDSIGVFGGSAGGHTALSLAGGEWSDWRFRDHCEKNIEYDFSSCVGFTTLLHGNWLDGLKIWIAKRIIASRFSNETVHRDFDPRIKAAVAMVPFAADFAPESLAQPKTALGLVVAAKDVNQIPRFHAEAILNACRPNCEVVMNLPEGSHGAMLSPLPPLAPGSIGSYLLSDPPSFDRARTIPELNSRIADFFIRHLLAREETPEKAPTQHQ
ncbi:MAG TPA: dienelactone hydrolase [Noviherbaspirillum sp.]|nr:dienelactone hydrolase [Noviherbaspirillum sp.]